MNMKIAERIKSRRDQVGKSQIALAEEVGVSKQAISNYERGTRAPSFEMVDTIALALNTTFGYLIGVTDNPSPLPPIADFIPDDPPELIAEQLVIDPTERELVDLYRSLNPAGQQTLIGTARGLGANPDMIK